MGDVRAVEAHPDVQAGGVVRELLGELHDLLAGRPVEQVAVLALGVLLGREAQAEVVLAQAGEVVRVQGLSLLPILRRPRKERCESRGAQVSVKKKVKNVMLD